MVLGLVLSPLLLTASLTRDSYGVPHIQASNLHDAYFFAGKACSQDRLWQMELSRRSARGRLAEVFGPSNLASDKDIALMGYTDAELETQLKGLSPSLQKAYTAYAEGVNSDIRERKQKRSLPAGYAEHGFLPEPWTKLDSAAIAVQIGRLFGAGGEGELRNYALLLYLKTQERVKDRYLDVIDDLAWQNDPSASCTVSPGDDPLVRTHPVFPTLTRAISEKHIASLPPTSTLELLPALKVASMESNRVTAEHVGVPFKVGSYCIVVAPSRSTTKEPILLSAPQMGHTSPAIIHEMSISSPAFKVAGMDVPGMPGVGIGCTPNFAWGLTSGVADTQDIFFSPRVDATSYKFGDKTEKLIEFVRTIKVKGQDPVKVTVRRTRFGPVILESRMGKVFYSKRSSHWMKEMQGWDVLLDLYKAKTMKEVFAATERISLNFNLFFAFRNGDIGWQYCGKIPVRSGDLDPRFPVPGDPQHDWKGFYNATQLPHLKNPRSGLITNWNNKPASWWPNFDTPVWGRIFRDQMLKEALPSGKISVAAVEKAAWTIARRDDVTCVQFQPWFKAALASERDHSLSGRVSNFDGWLTTGSLGAPLYLETVKQLRQEVFVPFTGNFLTDANLNMIIQPSVIWNALSNKTKFPWMGERSRDQVIQAAFDRAVTALTASQGSDPSKWTYNPGMLRFPGMDPVPYNNRGSYIQITTLGPVMNARNVVKPGVAESGAHAFDQVPLSREWKYKPMKAW